MFSNIDRMFDLAVSTPEDLVASFEIVEMQQEYNERRNKASGRVCGLYVNVCNAAVVTRGCMGS